MLLALLADRLRPILTVDLAMLLPFVFIAYQQLTAARLPLLPERNNVALLLVACSAAPVMRQFVSCSASDISNHTAREQSRNPVRERD